MTQALYTHMNKKKKELQFHSGTVEHAYNLSTWKTRKKNWLDYIVSETVVSKKLKIKGEREFQFFYLLSNTCYHYLFFVCFFVFE
jgi:hypothetical protein